MLTERQKKILSEVIEDYILSAEPVGSRTVSKKEDVPYSAATIRNEMADLEEMGFLEQPHTSAGRIPSQQGYRFYVDHLLKPRTWTTEDILHLHQYYSLKMDRVEQIFQHTSSIISKLTNYLTIVLGPKLSTNRLKALQLVPLSDRIAISILVTDNGQVHQQRITVPEEVSMASIEHLMQFLNHRLSGIPLSQIKVIMKRELADELVKHFGHYEKIFSLLERMLDTDHEDKVYTSGTIQMLTQPEFQDVTKFKSLLDVVEQNQAMFLMIPSQPGIAVRIGREHAIEAVNHCSIVTASYHVLGNPVGTIAILGPTRMNYGKVIGLLDLLTKDLSARMDSTFGKQDAHAHEP